MRQELIARLALGFAGICTAGGVAGVGLANYATAGSFDFYKQQRVAEWQPELPTQPTALESTDLAFASDRPGVAGDTETVPQFASFDTAD
jgi:hypothetical protein